MTMNNPAASDEIYAEPRAADAAAATRSAALLALPVSVAVSVGRARATIEELLAIGPQSILSLDSKIDDPVELIVGDRVIARGRLVEVGEGGAFGVEVIALVESQART